MEPQFLLFSWYLVEVDTTSTQKIVLPSLLIRRLTFHSARKMRTYENICFCYGKITYQSALKSYFAQIVELVNKKSDPSNFQRFRNPDQFCLNNGLYPSRTYSKFPLHDFYQFSELIFFLFLQIGRLFNYQSWIIPSCEVISSFFAIVGLVFLFQRSRA